MAAPAARPIADYRRTYFWIVPAVERDELMAGGFNDDQRRELIAESSRED